MSALVVSDSPRRSTMSEIARRPPGLRTRNASRNTAFLSGDRFTTQLEITTSTVLSERGMSSIVPSRNSTLLSPDSAWFLRASASISGVMSSPYAMPSGPTRGAESSTSMPPPEPRSSTISPSFRSASMVGLPHPSEAVTASAGRKSVSSLS